MEGRHLIANGHFFFYSSFIVTNKTTEREKCCIVIQQAILRRNIKATINLNIKTKFNVKPSLSKLSKLAKK